MTTFVAFLIFSIIVYLPMRLIFGDSSWLEPGHYPLPIQASRILLYAGYFFTGVGVGTVNLRTGMLAEDGALAKRWTVWLAFAFAFNTSFTIQPSRCSSNSRSCSPVRFR